MPRAQVRVRAGFCAALRLAIPGASDDENRAAFGVCFSAHFHGHDYLLEVAVEGEIDPRTGLVVDYAVLDELVDRCLIRELDHRNLNHDVDFLAGVIPTSENLISVFWGRLEEALPEGLRLVELRLRESRDHEVVLSAG